MEYEIYLDMYFIINFAINYIILLLVNKFIKGNATYTSMLLASIFTSIIICLVTVLPIKSYTLIFIFNNIIVSILLLCFGLRIRKRNEFVKALITLYIVSIIISGIFQMMGSYINIGSVFIALTVIIYYIVNLIYYFLCMLFEEKNKYIKVDVYIKDQILTFNALLDTGNMLRDGISNKPIHILDNEVCGYILDKFSENEVGTVKINTVAGMSELKIVTAEKIYLYKDKGICIEQAALAFSNTRLSSNNEFQMILNSNFF